MKGKIFVIEGSDGSGKKTQTEMLMQRAAFNSYKVHTLSFPQYEQFFGKEVRAYLNGEFGDLHSVPPKLASLLYSLDRFSVKSELNVSLNAGYNIFLNRYLESNMGYQGAKFDGRDREEFINWLYELEVKKLGLPESDLVLYLNLPLEFSQKAMEKEGRKKDIHESNINYLKKVEETYLNLASRNKKWIVIDCLEQERRLSISGLNQKIWNVVEKHLVK